MKGYKRTKARNSAPLPNILWIIRYLLEAGGAAAAVTATTSPTMLSTLVGVAAFDVTVIALLNGEITAAL